MDNPLPFAELLGGSKWEFQQSNASVHIANNTEIWFNFQSMKVLKWPACSPDRNPRKYLGCFVTKSKEWLKIFFCTGT